MTLPAEFARDAERLVGSAMRLYQLQHGLSEQELATRIGITVDRLGWLNMRTRPVAGAPGFSHEVRRLADAFRCNAAVLAEVLCIE